MDERYGERLIGAIEAKMRADRAIKGLIDALNDEDLYWAAANTLVMIGEPAVEPLINAIDYYNLASDRVVETLGRIGDARALEPLIATLKDEDRDVRAAAAEALGQLGDARAVEPLRTCHGIT